MFLGYFVTITLTILLFVPVLVFVAECGLALLLPSENTDPSGTTDHPRTAILIPAHNEASVITRTLSSLLPQLTPQDQILVVADNCSDNTAEVARRMGVQVLERENDHLRGKGYALDYGMQWLKKNPPEVVVILDADCLVSPNALPEISDLVKKTGRPVQATYLMEYHSHPTPKETVSRLALLIKNLVRPLGLAKLKLPCLLTGSGMGFPWSVLSEISLAGNKTADDMQLSVDLALAGYPAVYCPQARVIGRLMEDKAAISQRKRWEHGHLEMIMTETPRLFLAAIAQKRLDLLALTLELSVPPLSLLMMIWMSILGVGVWLAVVHNIWMPFLILAIQGLLIVLTVFLAWAKFGRDQIAKENLLAIPLYILWKIPIYLKFLSKPQTRWLTTERD
ncbi:glycosyl transferase family 2 [Gloeothece citriformis PCC 7424]|uniref:Glycosyl transferase family 2 n=1 Tax=Gloeothece citriformis (strain PCC 7424) TaxID=65393 RepID=B7KD14_GLOC7|nr:glycosyltransferase family 2 protein [Gloeothece citriformis]ACK73135.1 glycosyl transferase family 2 [Gloeothece citriformis PCC 7424]